MTALVDLQVIDGLGLPYAAGAEAALLDGVLDPVFNLAWQALDGVTGRHQSSWLCGRPSE